MTNACVYKERRVCLVLYTDGGWGSVADISRIFSEGRVMWATPRLSRSMSLVLHSLAAPLSITLQRSRALLRPELRSFIYSSICGKRCCLLFPIRRESWPMTPSTCCKCR